MADNYGNDSIDVLEGADRVRKRPGVMLGSDDIQGCQHAFFEVLSNSIDEARSGHGDEIIVKHDEGNILTVIDKGRGVPLDMNPTHKRYNWELIFCELWSGGKYDAHDAYEFSLGLNGLGAAAAQFTSEFMTVEVKRDGYHYIKHFKRGESDGDLIKEKYDGEDTGTKITWKPDLEVFTSIDIEDDYFHKVMKEQAIVNKGLRLVYINPKGEETVYHYAEGILDYVKELDEGKGFTKPIYNEIRTMAQDREDKPEYDLVMQYAMCFNNHNSKVVYFHNSSPLEHGGSPDRALRSAIVSVFDKYMKENDLYKKKEKKITYGDIEDSLIFVSNSFSSVTSYENQTKKAIGNEGIRKEMRKFLLRTLEVYLIENKLDADKICKQILVNKRSRERAETTRVNINKKLSQEVTITSKVEKFVDCRTKDTSVRELFIVEGDSAGGSATQGRDSRYQAVMPIRGKILNCLKADSKRIFNNDIIVDLVKILGCGVERTGNSKHDKGLGNFNLDNLKWDKVIIATDADVDGFQIRTLVLTMFYVLMPTLIKEGKVYIVESPLYEITSKKGEVAFAYSDREKDEVVKRFGSGCDIQRSKGLGQNEPEMMKETTMHPSTRKLIQVTMDDCKQAEEAFNIFLGDNLQGRKAYIEENGHLYIDEAEEV